MEVSEKRKFSELSFEEVNALALKIANAFFEAYELENEYLTYGPVDLSEIDPEKVKFHNEFQSAFKELLSKELSEEDIEKLYKVELKSSDPSMISFGPKTFNDYLSLVHEYIIDGSIEDYEAEVEIRKLIVDAICVIHHKLQVPDDVRAELREIRQEIAEIKKLLLELFSKLS